jgi:hypothetical protein
MVGSTTSRTLWESLIGTGGAFGQFRTHLGFESEVAKASRMLLIKVVGKNHLVRRRGMVSSVGMSQPLTPLYVILLSETEDDICL